MFKCQLIRAVHVVKKHNYQNTYARAHTDNKIVAIYNHVGWCFYFGFQFEHIMLGNEEASIRVWNKYIGDPKPKGGKIAYDIED